MASAPDPRVGAPLYSTWNEPGIGAGAKRGGGQRQSTRQQAYPAEPGAGDDVRPQTFSGNQGKCESRGPVFPSAPCASGRRPNALSTTPLTYTASAPPPWSQRGSAVVRANPRALDPYHSFHRIPRPAHFADGEKEKPRGHAAAATGRPRRHLPPAAAADVSNVAPEKADDSAADESEVGSQTLVFERSRTFTNVNACTLPLSAAVSLNV